MKSVWAASHSHWDKICSHVNHAVVFIDNPAAEVLHWHGGLTRLVKAGATDVKELSSFEVRSGQTMFAIEISMIIYAINVQLISA